MGIKETTSNLCLCVQWHYVWHWMHTVCVSVPACWGVYWRLLKLVTCMHLLSSHTETNTETRFKAASSHSSSHWFHTNIHAAEMQLARLRAKHFWGLPNRDERYDSTMMCNMWSCHPISPTSCMCKVAVNWWIILWAGTQLLAPFHIFPNHRITWTYYHFPF